jgi:hypothetical protein
LDEESKEGKIETPKDPSYYWDPAAGGISNLAFALLESLF